MKHENVDKNGEIIRKNDLVKIGEEIFKVFESDTGLFIRVNRSIWDLIKITNYLNFNPLLKKEFDGVIFVQDLKQKTLELFYRDKEIKEKSESEITRFLKLNQNKEILKWSQFSDIETADIPFHIFQYFKENQESFTPMQAYELAILACESQYQLRVIRGREMKQPFSSQQILTNNNWIESLLKFEGLIDYVLFKKLK